MSSIFTRIVNGEIPAAKIYEDDMTLAFLDTSPATRGHTLVIPKEEFTNLLDLPVETLAAVARTTQRVAQAITDVLKPDGFNVVQNNGTAAGQVVFHYHVHVIPRWNGDRAVKAWSPGSIDEETLQAVATELSAQLDKEDT